MLATIHHTHQEGPNMTSSTRYFACTAGLLASLAGTMHASAQQATAFAGIASDSLNHVTSPILESLDGAPVYMNVLSGYVYAAAIRETLDPDQSLSELVPAVDLRRENRGTRNDLIAIAPLYPHVTASSALYIGAAHGIADLQNTGVVGYLGSVLRVAVAPRTRVTFSSEISHELRFTAPANYRNPDDPDLPGVRAVTYNYLGPVQADVLDMYGLNRQLFDLDGQGTVCPACSDDGIYWQDQLLEPDPSHFASTDGVNAAGESAGTSIQQYTITNESHNEAIFHVMRFAGASAMNVVQTSAVPEVHTWALFGIGLLGVALASRRRA